MSDSEVTKESENSEVRSIKRLKNEINQYIDDWIKFSKEIPDIESEVTNKTNKKISTEEAMRKDRIVQVLYERGVRLQEEINKLGKGSQDELEKEWEKIKINKLLSGEHDEFDG